MRWDPRRDGWSSTRHGPLGTAGDPRDDDRPTEPDDIVKCWFCDAECETIHDTPSTTIHRCPECGRRVEFVEPEAVSR